MRLFIWYLGRHGLLLTQQLPQESGSFRVGTFFAKTSFAPLGHRHLLRRIEPSPSFLLWQHAIYYCSWRMKVCTTRQRMKERRYTRKLLFFWWKNESTLKRSHWSRWHERKLRLARVPIICAACSCANKYAQKKVAACWSANKYAGWFRLRKTTWFAFVADIQRHQPIRMTGYPVRRKVATYTPHFTKSRPVLGRVGSG